MTLKVINLKPPGFDYGKLVDLTEPEMLIQPVVPADPDLYPNEEGAVTSELDPGPAVNLYVTSPRGNKLEVFEEPEADEPVYSTVRKIRVGKFVFRLSPVAHRVDKLDLDEIKSRKIRLPKFVDKMHTNRVQLGGTDFTVGKRVGDYKKLTLNI